MKDMPKRRFHRFAIFLLALLVLGATLAVYFAPSVSYAEYGDIVMNREAEKAEMPPVIFPHWFHRIRFKCKVCHPDVFVMRAGANEVSMLKIIKGEYCGKCHNGRIAWAPLYCDRCHSGKSEFSAPPVPEFQLPE